MSSVLKKIEAEQNFAQAAYKDFNSKRYGLTSCCQFDLEDLRIKKELCDYQDLKKIGDALEPTSSDSLTIVSIPCDVKPSC
jgi:hypothetical protein